MTGASSHPLPRPLVFECLTLDREVGPGSLVRLVKGGSGSRVSPEYPTGWGGVGAYRRRDCRGLPVPTREGTTPPDPTHSVPGVGGDRNSEDGVQGVVDG